MLKALLSLAILPSLFSLAACNRHPETPATAPDAGQSGESKPLISDENSDADALQGTAQMSTTDGGVGGKNGADEGEGVGGRDMADETLVRSGINSTTRLGNEKEAREIANSGIDEAQQARIRTALRTRGYTVIESNDPAQNQESIREALLKFQKDRKLEATGRLDKTTASALNFQETEERSPASINESSKTK